MPPLPEVRGPKFLEIRNPWGKVLERSGLRILTFLLGSGLKSPRKKKFVFADFALFCVEELVWSPSYYTRGAHLITRVEPILLHAWSPKNGGWVQSVHRPRVEPSRGRVYAWMRGHVNRPIFLFYFFFF